MIKKKFQKYKNAILPVLLSVTLVSSIAAQQLPTKNVRTPKTDSPRIANAVNVSDSLKQQSADSGIGNILARLSELDIRINRCGNKMKWGFTIENISQELTNYEKTIRFLDSNMINKNGLGELNFRNISSFQVLLIQFEKNLKNRKTDIEKYSFSINEALYGISKEVKAISLPVLSENDSILSAQYRESIQLTRLKLTQLNHLHDSLFASLGLIQSRTTQLYIKTNELLDEVAQRVNLYSKEVFTKTHTPLWQQRNKADGGNLFTSISSSLEPAVNILFFFLSNSPFLILICFFIPLCFILWVNTNYFSLKKTDLSHVLDQIKFLNRSRIVIYLIFFFMLAPFMFNTPPALFMELMWLGAALVCTIILWPNYNSGIRLYWLAILFLFIYFGLDNLLYTDSNGERWYLLVGNLIAIFLGIVVYANKTKIPERSTRLFNLIVFLLLGANMLAFILNILGWFPLAKLLSISSILQLVVAVCLYVFSKIVKESVFIQFENKKNNPSGISLESEGIRKAIMRFVTIGAVIYWLMTFIWSLSFSEIIRLLIKEQMGKEINIGNLTFTAGAVFTFCFSIGLSIVIANLLSVFFGNAEQQFANPKKSKMGSWMVVIRLSVIIAGILIAFASAGIPIDKLAIVFGALSVGIGFGLQDVVNNLVSGIILAFEKPMQIGDVVEIDTHMGVVKQIGLRSSKVTTYDGADIIVPNGHFISKKLINWTHSNSFRRIELFVDVAYGSDPEKVISLINEAAIKIDKVMKYPKPKVFVHEFAASGLNFRVLIWTSEFDSWQQIKSELHEVIYKTFAENEIEIPYPKTDVYIKSTPGQSI